MDYRQMKSDLIDMARIAERKADDPMYGERHAAMMRAVRDGAMALANVIGRYETEAKHPVLAGLREEAPF